MKRIHHPKRRKQGFTLIELLAVIGLIILLAAVTIPAFSALVQGTGVKAAAAQVRGAMTQARTHAIMNNTVVDFIVMTLAQPVGGAATSTPTAFTTTQAAERAQDYIYRGFALYDRVNNRYVKPWTKLPEGIVFDNASTLFTDYNGTTANFLDPAQHATNADPAVVSKYRYYVPREPTGAEGPSLIRYCPSIRFRPNARATSPMNKNNSTADRVAVVMAEGAARYLVDGATGAISMLSATGNLVIKPGSARSAVYVYHYNSRTEIEYK
ncbi:MAG: prepilin-type N-terminal cleavage/methylation domain-containing protein [Kiritimatiellia bacterium]